MVSHSPTWQSDSGPESFLSVEERDGVTERERGRRQKGRLQNELTTENCMLQRDQSLAFGRHEMT